MNLLIPANTEERIRAEMRRAGRHEVGGLLLGEHLSANTFRLSDVTVQRDGGGNSYFIRDPDSHATQLAIFFERTGWNYTRFNYLGEWHSHPSAPVVPSPNDIVEMMRLVEDPEVGVTFAVLLIVRLTRLRRLKGSLTDFRPSQTPRAATLIWERRPDIGPFPL